MGVWILLYPSTMFGLRDGNFQSPRRRRYQIPLASMLCVVANCYMYMIIIHVDLQETFRTAHLWASLLLCIRLTIFTLSKSKLCPLSTTSCTATITGRTINRPILQSIRSQKSELPGGIDYSRYCDIVVCSNECCV